MTATTVLMLTVEPSAALISVRVPAAGDGISASTLSVEISKIGSSRWTVSPTFLSHLVMVPSVMDSPICGMRTSVPGPDEPEACAIARGSERFLRGLLVAHGGVDRGGSDGVFLGRHGAGVRGSSGAGGRFGAVLIDGGDDGVDADGRAFLHLDFAERAGDGRGDLGVDLVG